MVKEVWERVATVLFVLPVFWSILTAVVFAINAISAESTTGKVIHTAFSATLAIIGISIARIVKREFLEH